MRRLSTSLAFVIWLFPIVAAADLPARGKLLVATEQVRGEVFAQTVILLLHYDDRGAMGIVVNRPTDIVPEEVVDNADLFSSYQGALYWGGPVQMDSLRALLRTETPPPGAETIIKSVHHVDIDAELMNGSTDPARLRFYIGYAGWSAGQLDSELARGSWHIVPSSGDHVFDADPRTLWERVKPSRRHLAVTPSNPPSRP